MPYQPQPREGIVRWSAVGIPRNTSDLGDLNPRWEFRASSGKATVHSRAQMKTRGCVEQTGLNRHPCVKELSNQMWPFTIMDHKTKRNRQNTDVSDSILLRFCVSPPPRSPSPVSVKEPSRSAFIKNTRGFTHKKPQLAIMAPAGHRLISDTVASTFTRDGGLNCTCGDLSRIPIYAYMHRACAESEIPAIIQHAEQARGHHAIRPRSKGATEDRMKRREEREGERERKRGGESRKTKVPM